MLQSFVVLGLIMVSMQSALGDGSSRMETSAEQTVLDQLIHPLSTCDKNGKRDLVRVEMAALDSCVTAWLAPAFQPPKSVRAVLIPGAASNDLDRMVWRYETQGKVLAVTQTRHMFAVEIMRDDQRKLSQEQVAISIREVFGIGSDQAFRTVSCSEDAGTIDASACDKRRVPSWFPSLRWWQCEGFLGFYFVKDWGGDIARSIPVRLSAISLDSHASWFRQHVNSTSKPKYYEAGGTAFRLSVEKTSPLDQNTETCWKNLATIRNAKERWSIEKNAKPGAVVKTEDLVQFLSDGLPHCPTDGEYIISPLGVPPRCSKHGGSADGNGDVLGK